MKNTKKPRTAGTNENHTHPVTSACENNAPSIGLGDQQQPLTGHSTEHNQSPGMHGSNAPATIHPALDEIHRLYGELWDMGRVSLDKAIRIGEILTNLKEECGHGNWLPFVEEHLPFSERKAQTCMEYYRNGDALKSAISADLPICRARQLMPRAASKRPTSDTPLLGEPGPSSPSTSSTPDMDRETKPKSQSEGRGDLDADEPVASDPALARSAATTSTGSDRTPPASDPPPVPEDDNGQDERVLFRLLDGTEVTGWQEGLISAKVLKCGLQEFAHPMEPIPEPVRLAQQRVLLAAAREMNRVCGADLCLQTLYALEEALLIPMNSLRGHKNYNQP